MCHTEFSIVYEDIYLQAILNYLLVLNYSDYLHNDIVQRVILYSFAYITCNDTFICLIITI